MRATAKHIFELYYTRVPCEDPYRSPSARSMKPIECDLSKTTFKLVVDFNWFNAPSLGKHLVNMCITHHCV